MTDQLTVKIEWRGKLLALHTVDVPREPEVVRQEPERRPQSASVLRPGLVPVP